MTSIATEQQTKHRIYVVRVNTNPRNVCDICHKRLHVGEMVQLGEPTRELELEVYHTYCLAQAVQEEG